MTYPTLAFVTQQVSPSDNGIRTGTISSVDPLTTRAVVIVGGTPVELQYLNREYPPAPGDTVALVRQDASWLILGTIAGEPVRPSGIVGAGISSTSTTVTSGGAEVAAGWAVEPEFPAVPGRYYRVAWEARAFVSGGVIALVFGQVRLREGPSSTTNPLLASWIVQAESNFSAHTVGGWCLLRYRGTQERPVVLSLTLAKAAGTGTNINLIGDAISTIRLTIEDVTDVIASQVSVMAAIATDFTYEI